MIKMASILKTHIVKNGLYVNIKGKNYVEVEGWQFAGGLTGLYPKIVEVKELAKGKWFAQANLIDQRTDKVVTSGFALCSKEEVKKRSFDEYAILSMAQTRAIGKVFRNVLAWVMKAAGYAPTPAEEVVKVGDMEKQKEKTEEEKGKAGELKAGQKEKRMIENYCTKLGYGDPEKAMAMINKMMNKKIDYDELTKKDASDIIFRLLEKINSKNKNGKNN